MEEIKLLLKNIAKLVDVKTIITLAVTYILYKLALGDKIQPETFMTVVGTVYGYYFGTKTAEAKHKELMTIEKIKKMDAEKVN